MADRGRAHLRSLNTQRRVAVEPGEDGRPAVVTLNRRKLLVEEWHESWRIDDEWWRAKPIARVYWRVSLEDGRTVDLYEDLADGGWFRQSYG